VVDNRNPRLESSLSDLVFYFIALKERLTELKAFVHGHEKKSTKSLELLFDSHMGKFVKPANSPDIVATLSSNVQQKQKKKVAVDILIITNNEEGHPAQSLYLGKSYLQACINYKFAKYIIK
jgi:hypothetical protein